MLWILVLCIFELICSSYTADPEEVYGRKGSSYTFVCPHRKTSHNNVHWAFINKSGSYFVISEGTFIVSIYRDRVDVVGNHSIGEYNLKLSGLQESDEGTYTCGASRQRKSYNFELLVAPSALVLYNTINDTILSTEGKSLTINCTAIGGNPEPDLKLDVDSQVVTGKQSVILAIPALEKTHDKQLVKCQAVHDGLQTPLERNASLYLYLKPSVPVFSTDTPRTNETEQLIVSCTSTGSRPAGVIYWKLKSKMLSSRFIQQNNFDSLTETFTILSTLTYSLDRSLNGQPITCGVTHQTLRQVLETTKTVNVNYPPNVTVSDVTYNQTDDNRTLQCNLEGNPTKYTYFKWKHKSKYGVMIRELHGSQDGILTLPDVPESERYQDSGEYICIAGNGIGDRHGNIQQKGYGHVTINAQPVFTKDNKNIRTQYGETGKDVSIYIYVYSVPKHTTIKWFKLNREIFQSVKYSMAEEYVIVHHGFYGKEVQLDGFRIKVTINLLRYEDFSNYTLKVSNEFGHYVQHEIMLKYGVTDQGPLSQNSDQNSTSQPVFVVGLTLTLATILLWTVLGFIYYRRKLAAKRVQLPIKDAKDPISTSGDTRRREEDSIPEIKLDQYETLGVKDRPAVYEQLETNNSSAEGLFGNLCLISADQQIHHVIIHTLFKETPKLPVTRPDIQLEGKWTQTSAREQFLFADDSNAEKILTFTATRNLTNLVAADTIYGDGTFYTSPTQFAQLFTLHAMVDVVMYPLVFGLLPGKSEEIYDRYFNLLKTACQQHQLQLAPNIFFTDFETATQNSVQQAFTNTTLKSCFFHYTQCIWRKTQKLGLATSYKENDDLKLFVRRVAVLPIVPPELAEDVWFFRIRRRRGHPHQHHTIRRLRHRVLGRRKSSSALEPLDNEGPRTNNHLEG